MIYIYDIILNLTDDDRILEFFEWNEKDNIEHIKKIPLLKVNNTLMNDILNHEIKVDNNFLESIKNYTELFDIKKRKIMEYVCLFSDGPKVIASEFASNGKLLYRSSLLLDEEEEILDIVDNMDEQKINYKKLKPRNINFFLTRKELFIKNYLLKELKSSYKKNNIKENSENMYKELIEDINNNFSNNHIKLFNILTMKEVKK